MNMHRLIESVKGEINVNRGCAKNYFLTAIKLLCILSMLNFSLLFGYTDTATAIGSPSSKPQHQPPRVNPSQDLAQKLEPAFNNTKTIIIPISHITIHNIINGRNLGLTGNINTDDMKQKDTLNPAENVDISDSKENIDSQENAESAQSTDEKQDAGEADSAQGKRNNSRIEEIMAYQEELNKIYRHREEKVACLTFDDGPTPSITSAILDILAKEEVKATFFVIGSNAERYPDLVKRIYQEGHGIGNHTYSHVFKHIYASTENYIDELATTNGILNSILGDDKSFMLTRFPGGSFGEKLAPFREAVNKAGYLYIDWNCVNGDAETTKTRTADQLISRFKDTAKGLSSLVILMHDAPKKDTTVQALPEIIRYLKAENYRFELLPWSR